MKIFKKRVIAYFIDALVLGLLYELIRRFLNDSFSIGHPIVYVAIFAVFFLKDIIFINASIGKFIVGIRIYDINWKKPNFLTLIKRAFLTSIAGFVYIFKSKRTAEDVMLLFDWERNSLKTAVIDRKVYKKIKTEAKAMKGEYSQNMSDLYNMYLRDMYCK